MAFISAQNRMSRSEEVRACLKIRLNEMKLRIKKRKERFDLDCSSFDERNLSTRQQLSDSGCLLDEEFATKQNLDSLRNIRYLQAKFDEKLKKRSKKTKTESKTFKETRLNETILSIVDISTFNKLIGSESNSKNPSRTSTPIISERRCIIHRKQHKKFSSSARKMSSSVKKSDPFIQNSTILANTNISTNNNKYFNIRENNYYNYSINLNAYENKISQYASLLPEASANMPVEFQDFGDFKIWYV
jgi:hypothetical protein